MSFPIALCCPHPAQSITHTVPFIAFLRGQRDLHPQRHESAPSSKRRDTSEIRKPPLKCTGRKQILRVYGGRESTQEWQDVQSSPHGKRVGPFSLNVPPKLKGENHTERLRGRGGSYSAIGTQRRPWASPTEALLALTCKITKMPTTGTQRTRGRTFSSVALCQKSTVLL